MKCCTKLQFMKDKPQTQFCSLLPDKKTVSTPRQETGVERNSIFDFQ